MDDKLILSVFNFPELYNVTLPNYRCAESRNNAWRSIGTLMCLPTEECKRKWKNLRDRYLKEVRNELKTRQQGEFIPSRWKHRQLLNFIAPFTGSRNGVAENGDDDDGNHGNESCDDEGETSDAALMALANMKASVGQVDSKAQMAFMAQLSPSSPASQMAQLAFLTKLPSTTQISPLNKPGRKRRLLSMPAVPASKTKRQANKDIASSFSNRQRDEDEMFLLSFVPALKRLTPQKRCETKIKIQQIMFEAEFSAEQPKSQEKLTETESEKTDTQED